MLSARKVEEAYQVLKGVVVRTSLHYDRYLSEKYGAEIFTKRENEQRVRSFKIRGAYYAISQLTDQEKMAGVVCASAGNHAQGVAYTCNIQFLSGKPQIADGHFILRKGSGLVGTDNGRTAESFDGGELLDESVLLRHTLNRHGKRERNRRQKTFGNERDDHTERKDECGRYGFLNKKDGGDKKENTERHCDNGDLLGQLVQLFLKRA